MKLKIKVSDILGRYKKNQKWLCDKTGIRAATIQNYYYETVKRMNVEDLEKIFEAFYEIDKNLKIEDLFEIKI